jgi:hypothetical protein
MTAKLKTINVTQVFLGTNTDTGLTSIQDTDDRLRQDGERHNPILRALNAKISLDAGLI